MREVDDPFAYCAALPLRFRAKDFRNPHKGELYLSLDGQVHVKAGNNSNRRPRLILEHTPELYYEGKKEAFMMIMGSRLSICGTAFPFAFRSVITPW